ncbi:MAG: MMPL family transporter [Actinomycetota bacterium]|nr:MMPL family transporter [Actinomycetota bacterium]
MSKRLPWFLSRVAARPLAVIVVVFVLALGGGALALGLRPSAGADTFVSRSSPAYRADQTDHVHFGGDAVIVLIREPLNNLVESADLAQVSALEACLSGQVLVKNKTLVAFTTAPPGTTPYGGWSSPCGKLAKARAAQVVYGPGTFLNQAVVAINSGVRATLAAAGRTIASAGQAAYQLALSRGYSVSQALKVQQAARTLESQQQIDTLGTMALDLGIQGTPAIDSPQFISQVVFDPTRGVNQPKARFAYLFPTARSALIQVRLKASLSDDQQAAAIQWIREAVKMPMFRLIYRGTYTVAGAPVVTDALASQITTSIAGLLIAALVVMALALLVVFRGRMRLLPLAIALAAAGLTFGAMALAGATLTMASIAVLPILIGLAVDYAIQFQSRASERRGDDEGGVLAGIAAGAPTIATAALATATGFLVLLLSPVPMVRSFGVLLVGGIAFALACALTVGTAAMLLDERGGGGLAASVRGASQILGDARRAVAKPIQRASALAPPTATGLLAPLRRAGRSLGRIPVRSVAAPHLVLACATALAVIGWAADTQTGVQSDVTKLVPASMPALRDLHTLERITGVSGEIDVVVRARDVATPQTLGWMIRYENTLFEHFGYRESTGCSRSTLCPALSLPDLFQTARSSSANLTQASIDSTLGAVPPYFSRAVITAGHRVAALAFGIRLMPLARQQRVIDYMRSQLHPPPGVTADLAGLPVLAAQADGALASVSRRMLTLLAGLAAVALVLMLTLRSVRRGLAPLIPIVFATGWSALIVFMIGIPLNPMSATLGTLVIAISTEFSVLLSERYRQERSGGLEPTDALLRTYRRTGVPVLASGLTAIAGFGVLTLSSIVMLRDFGLVTVIDLSVSLAGVMLVLPSVLAISERADLADRARARIRRVATALPRPRRRARVA